jgi:hypothetical protein
MRDAVKKGCELLSAGPNAVGLIELADLAIRVGALTAWGADAERVCVPEKDTFEVPEDLDPAGS